MMHSAQTAQISLQVGLLTVNRLTG